jgi:ABC-type phosphonate transport system ATPase subunit
VSFGCASIVTETDTLGSQSWPQSGCLLFLLGAGPLLVFIRHASGGLDVTGHLRLGTLIQDAGTSMADANVFLALRIAAVPLMESVHAVLKQKQHSLS